MSDRRVLALKVLSLVLALTLLGFLPGLVFEWHGPTVCRKEPMDLPALAGAILGYAREHGGRAPSTLEELVEPTPSGERWLDLDSIPRDGWGRPYLYEPLREGSGSVRLACLGADGLPGGDGEDQDCELRVLLGSR
jgi:hypothetical protein